MESVVLVIHLFLALAIIGLVLIQRSEGGGLGIGGGGGGMGKLASAQGASNFLTKATTWCAIAFFCTSLVLAVLAGRYSQKNESVLEALDVPTIEAPVAPADDMSDSALPPDTSEGPSAPIAE